MLHCNTRLYKLAGFGSTPRGLSHWILPMKHCRLIYTSTATADVVSNETLGDLAAKAGAANAEHAITGMLILSGRKFLQVLEGPTKDVNALFRNIVADPRHHDVELVTFEPMDTPYFDNWDMRLVDLYDLPKQPRDYLAAKYQHKDGIILIPEHLHEVYALLLDAKALCLTNPWQTPKNAPPSQAAS
jgi:hypothetical protein